MHSVRRSVYMLALAVLLCEGCSGPVAFQDVSTDPGYHPYVGAAYELKVPMHLSGVNAPPGYAKRVDYYTVNPASPSWSGPELITRETLPPGTTVSVASVRRCTNCIFDFGPRVEATFHIEGFQTEFPRPIYMNVKYLTPDFAHRRRVQPARPTLAPSS